MFFWFAHDSFSIVDALLKLILVITGSVLIICFCHRLTNYKKSRRFKSSSSSNFLAGPALHQSQTLELTGTGRPATFTAGDPYGTQRLLAAYDPYNTIRPFGHLDSHLVPTHLQVAPGSAYGFHSAAGALDTLQALQQSNSINHQTIATSGAQATSINSAGGQQLQNLLPIYSTSLQSPADCSTFRAQQLDLSDSAELCPTYEEALASDAQIHQSSAGGRDAQNELEAPNLSNISNDSNACNAHSIDNDTSEQGDVEADDAG